MPKAVALAATYVEDNATPREAESWSPERASDAARMGYIAKTQGVNARKMPNTKKLATTQIGPPDRSSEVTSPESVSCEFISARGCLCGSRESGLWRNIVR